MKKPFITKDFNGFINLRGSDKIKFTFLNLTKFFYSVYRSNKFTELSSFIFWEFKTKLRLWRNNVLVFEKKRPIIISDNNLDTDFIVKKINSEFIFENIEIEKLKIDWNIIYAFKGEIWGNLLLEKNILYKSLDNGKTVEKIFVFENEISSIFITKKNIIFICADGVIFRSDDFGITFKNVLILSSKNSTFLFRNGMTETATNILLIGEYDNLWKENKGWINTSKIYFSFNDGVSWSNTDFLAQNGVNKHVHMIKYLTNIDKLILTDGDNKKQLWVNKTNMIFNKKSMNGNSEGWKLHTKYHFQTGGYITSLEVNDYVILGTDYLGGTNFLIKTRDFNIFEKKIIPDPYRKGIISALNKTDEIIWAVITPPEFNSSKGLLMCTTSFSRPWIKIIEFDLSICDLKMISDTNQQNCSLFFSITFRKRKSDNYFVFQINSKN